MLISYPLIIRDFSLSDIVMLSFMSAFIMAFEVIFLHERY